MERKRAPAVKLSISLIHQARIELDQEQKFRCIALGDKEITKVNIIATIVDKFESSGEKSYAYLTLDDGSGTIRAKAFAETVALFKQLELGDTVLCIGSLRYFQNELYITPDIIKKIDPKWLIARKLELDQLWQQREVKVGLSLKQKILELVRKADSEEGLPADELILSLKEPVEQINEAIKQLLDEGVLFEPKPGRLRLL